MKTVTFLLLFGFTSLFACNWIQYSNGYDYCIDVNSTFSSLQNQNVYGDFAATGDSILYVDDGSNPDLINSHTSYKQEKIIPVFTNAVDTRKRNSSTAILNLPSYVTGNDIVWAGLFWQGHINESGITGKSDSWIDKRVRGWDKVTIASQDGAISSIVANPSRIHHIAVRDPDNFRYFYGAYADVTSFVKMHYSNTNNHFTVGNIMTTAGKEKGASLYINNANPPLFLNNSAKFGYYGGWSLIVVYSISDPAIVQNNSIKLKNVSLYEGYDLFLTWGSGTVPFTKDISISGFYTPRSGAVNSKLLLFGGGGDKHITGDTLQFLSNNGFVNLFNIPNPNQQQFNHTYTNLGVDIDTGSTTATNKQGMDLDTYDISSLMNNGQSNATVRFGVIKTGPGYSGSCDQIFPQVIGFSTELYQPTFCYDYAYKQNGKYFTEDFNITTSPRLIGNNLFTTSSTPIEMSLFLRNTVDSDIAVNNVTISITDINTTQTDYAIGSTAMAKNSSLVKTPLPTYGLTNIPLGSFNSNEYAYLYYNLVPHLSSIDTPIKATLNYTVTINGQDINYTSRIPSPDIPICKETGAPVYNAQSGIFNVVHNNFYDFDVGGTKQYYNIPTQITKREGNFKILSFKDDGVFNTLQNRTTAVAVDMVDVSAFQSTFASCNELTANITGSRVWVVFDNNDSVPFTQSALQNAIANGMTTLTNSSDFYKTARRDAAFRITFNQDANGSLVSLESVTNGTNTRYNVTDYTNLIKLNNGICSTDIDGNPNNVDTIAHFCSNAGSPYASAMTQQQLANCMKCVYGINTKAICSRDNFSIRPEAFLITLQDQNQTNSIQKTPIANNHSGVVSPTTTVINLAAGYQYLLDVNATDFLGNNASYGYTKRFNLSTQNTAKYSWEPRNSHIVTGCNDTTDKDTTLYFHNGSYEGNSSISQVGEYRLNIRDTSWTIVDSNTAYQGHHKTPYFLVGTGTDCQPNVATTEPINSPNLNGCNISSSHTNPNVNLVYNDYNITVYPYKFDPTGISSSTNLNYTPITTSSFVYMANIDQDEKMSYHFNGIIAALGEDNTSLSNFVDQCYALPLTISIGSSNRDLNDTLGNHVTFKGRFHDMNITTNQPMQSLDLNKTDATPTASNFTFNLTTAHFYKSSNGTLMTAINLNYDRKKDKTVNPKNITFFYYDVNCSTGTDCAFNADFSNNKTPRMRKDFNNTITYYYGRSNTGKQRFSVPDDSPYTSNIYYEVYCYGAGCNTTLLPSTQHAHDIRWYINTLHSTTNDGNVSNVLEDGGNNYVQPTNLLNNTNVTTVELPYDGTQGYPYQTTMDINTSGWLIYDPDDANATYNKFDVEYYKAGNGWSGKHETNATTKTNGAPVSNRRTMW